MNDNARIWIYQSNRVFTDKETEEITKRLKQFTSTWKAHGRPMNADAEVRENTFIIIAADESTTAASGCSIDASVRVIKEIEQDYGVDLFDRFNMAYNKDGEVRIANKETFQTLLQIGEVGPETLVYNNMVQTVAELRDKWKLRLADSWHDQVFKDFIPS